MASPEAEEMKRSIERILLLIPDWKMYNMVKQEEGVEAMTRVVLFGHQDWVRSKIAQMDHELLDIQLEALKELFRNMVRFEAEQLERWNKPVTTQNQTLLRCALSFMEMAWMQRSALRDDDGQEWCQHVTKFKFDGDCISPNRGLPLWGPGFELRTSLSPLDFRTCA